VGETALPRGVEILGVPDPPPVGVGREVEIQDRAVKKS
jgi:hypothetical protein